MPSATNPGQHFLTRAVRVQELALTGKTVYTAHERITRYFVTTEGYVYADQSGGVPRSQPGFAKVYRLQSF